MQISSLDITLRRINQIERQFSVLDKREQETVAKSFGKALDNAMQTNNQENTTISTDFVKYLPSRIILLPTDVSPSQFK